MNNVKTIDLRTPDLRDPKTCPVGTIVISTKGFNFKLVERTVDGKESWLDETSDLIWHDVEEGKYNHYQAQEKFGKSLPTKEKLKEAKSCGLFESGILPNTAGHWFWTASVSPDSVSFAYVLDGNDGDIYGGNRDYNYGSVRLVSAKG